MALLLSAGRGQSANPGPHRRLTQPASDSLTLADDLKARSGTDQRTCLRLAQFQDVSVGAAQLHDRLWLPRFLERRQNLSNLALGVLSTGSATIRQHRIGAALEPVGR